MSDARQETVADIVREMRIGDLCAEDTSAARPAYINDILASYADRIEAAWKREREAGAAAAQICGKIGEIVGRATTEKSSAVINTDTVRGIAQEMLNTSMQDTTAERINGWAMRLAEACEQPATDCNQLNNAAAMRKALEKVRFYLPYFLQYVRLHDAQSGGYYEKKLEVVNAALSAPPRNCDVGTAEEQAERFKTFCYIYPLNCAGCPLKDSGITHNECAIFWTQMPYEEGGEK